MNRSVCCLAGCTIVSLAYAGWRDDFEGENYNITDKWSKWTEYGSSIHYAAHDGLLHVTGMKYPVRPETVHWLDKWFPENAWDFETETRLGWLDTTKGGIGFGAWNTFPYSKIASFSLEPGRLFADIILGGGAGRLTINKSIPKGGFFTAKITRVGRVVSVYWDGELILQGSQNNYMPYQRTHLSFSAASEEDRMDYFVDYVSIIPEPGTFAATLIGGGLLAWRHKRRRSPGEKNRR
ncbi:MAG: hypothetical protein HONBIEJF_02380 [Fimbriimonadaceae bacterium]|nr:hypothetical protein [Fimbriimonadaceae bacterium]